MPKRYMRHTWGIYWVTFRTAPSHLAAFPCSSVPNLHLFPHVLPDTLIGCIPTWRVWAPCPTAPNHSSSAHHLKLHTDKELLWKCLQPFYIPMSLLTADIWPGLAHRVGTTHHRFGTHMQRIILTWCARYHLTFPGKRAFCHLQSSLCNSF